MSQLVECVPNFSEGNNKEVIDAISGAIAQTPGCVLLDVDAGPSTNRTVCTFVGRPECVVSGALNAARIAWRLIDMSQHRGEHPRMGALDVCPFIPVRGVSMEDCVLCAQAFGQQLAEELSVPVYLYGEAAKVAGRRSLPAVRAGEYEGLPEKLKQAEWAPDFGPSTFVPSWGATVTGARKFLIAFNINLLGTKEQAHRIALNLREQGRGKDQPGRLKKVQGIGWYLEEKKLAQVSTNLLDFEVTALHTVYEETCREAQELSLPVVGSQLVGLVPLQALLDAAAFYCHRENLFVLEEEHRIRLVIPSASRGICAELASGWQILAPGSGACSFLALEAVPGQCTCHFCSSQEGTSGTGGGCHRRRALRSAGVVFGGLSSNLKWEAQLSLDLGESHCPSHSRDRWQGWSQTKNLLDAGIGTSAGCGAHGASGQLLSLASVSGGCR
ncbi:formimidoyltransferase-cyclodeaminase isoform X11 [Heterocephalus glaber]|uniref:glutamate formimidoyltransferase n=1 Tax=Heterocephalus glaber TaxID=10181 RepID=A0AAX6QW83_HETGA|nr:formimidoyltransferase-cyclodeaminase isoform X11 [Heterocephalus glaber]